MKTIQPLITLVAIAGTAACASTQPSKNLVTARHAYEDAKQSPASELRPAKLQEAEAALIEAEEAHDAKPRSFREKSLAYIAHRKALAAIQYGEQAKYDREYESAKQEEKELLREQRNAAEMNLEETEKELQRVQSSLDERGEELNETTEMLREREQELQARQQELEEARAKADKAIASLKEIAQIKEEQQQLVITLSGEVLFEFGKAKLLPTAKRRLDQVAAALKAQDEDKQIVIEGHTDSVGTEERNRKLSLERARSVQQYLVEKGVDKERVKAVGRGESEPVASNDTPEGRANNRRVEIILGE